ncbi:NEDD4 family-interacting protein 1-like [Phthorimaea operculella]|nr:NEDD4 family-interacting protein 1-like [Phthorimaea operculella]
MTVPRTEAVCPPPHLRVILPNTLDATMVHQFRSLDNTMPPQFIDMNNTHDIPPPQPDFSAPPPYDVAANSKLPTYEEVQREKQMEGEGPPQMHGMPPPHPTFAAFVTVENGEGANGVESLDPENSLLGTDIMFLTSFFVTVENGEGANGVESLDPENSLLGTDIMFLTSFFENGEGANGVESLDPENSLLGTDIMFLTSFFVAFLFNWIGFLLLMCFCHTVASRYGALAGFGLSLAKWTLIVKHSTELASHENSWLWWLIMAFGILICVRAIIQYLNIKRGWRLLSGTAQERLLFFY